MPQPNVSLDFHRPHTIRKKETHFRNFTLLEIEFINSDGTHLLLKLFCDPAGMPVWENLPDETAPA